MYTIMHYITCDGRYSVILAYHLRLLMVFEGVTLNMPHFFLKSLERMSKTYQKKLDLKSIFHHGLIHILLQHELVKYHMSWDRFLSKIQLDDGKNLRNYAIDQEKDMLPSDSKENNEKLSDQPANILQQLSDRKQSSHEIPEQSKIDISFGSKRQARLCSRMTIN